jgi:hypothetical protein
MLGKIKSVVFGVRYVRSFRISSIIGEIVDDILKSRESPFDSDKFSKIKEDRLGTATLYNDDENNEDELTISKDDIILRQGIKNFDEDYKNIENKLIPYIIKIILKNNIKRISRFGLVFEYFLENKNKIIKNFELKSEFMKDPVEFFLRTSKKIPTPQGLSVKGKDGYKNVIYTFKSDEKGMNIGIDYQSYFIPSLENINDGRPLEFLGQAKNFITKEINWLDKISENKHE